MKEKGVVSGIFFYFCMNFVVFVIIEFEYEFKGLRISFVIN